jgi:hypothetical protein
MSRNYSSFPLGSCMAVSGQLYFYFLDGLMMFFWVLTQCRSVGNSNVSEKRTLSIFRGEVVMLGIRGIHIGSEEGIIQPAASHFNPEVGTASFSGSLASTFESRRRQKTT